MGKKRRAMQKQLLSLLGMVSFGTSSLLNAYGSDVRTPLSGYSIYGPTHYLLDPVEPVPGDYLTWTMWKEYYERRASKTFRKDDCECPAGSLNDVTTETAPLSALFFGKDTFRGEEAFFGGMLVDTPAPPALIFSQIRPRFEYQEWGVFTGVNVYHAFKRSDNGAWRAGLSLSLPIKLIEVNQRVGCGTEEPLSESLDDVRQLKIEDIGDGAFEQVFAYRLDFLTALQLPNGAPMVVYGDGTVANRTMVAGYVVAGNADNVDSSAVNGNVPIHVLGRPDGTIPPVDASPGNQALGGVPYAAERTIPPAINNVLPADGTLAENDRAFFQQAGFDYAANLALDRDAQGRLFVVPRADGEAITDDAVTIMNIVEEVLANGIGDETAVEFFDRCCIRFCNSVSTVGVGDFDTTGYIGYHADSGSFFDIQFGARWPTGKKNDDARRLLFVQPGNNGHIELHVGAIGGWRPNDWFALSLDAMYSHVFRGIEHRAATFEGATVVNIGPLVDANVSWNYFVAHIDFNFFHPRNRDLGTEIGYEFFVRSKDKLRYCQDTAVDCLDRNLPIDECLAASLSKSQSHKIRGETFYRIGFGEIFIGASQVFAGKFVMKESEWHVGMQIWF